ncbi:hypothetical protein LIER_11516 [Lithospermum erythrorhizon]|uniref:Uncharacterized protein n=1 Tax=Lithospermum erythrorhizon TaxID=34254 RepID=A0AAV3PQ86_LITER
MASFSTEGEHPNLHLRTHEHEEDEDTYLVAHPPLHKGFAAPWEALTSRDARGDMSWTPGESSRHCVLVGRGHSRDEPPRIYHILREDVATRRDILPLLFMDYLSVLRITGNGKKTFLVDTFVEYWSLSSNTLLLPHGETSISLWDLYELGGLLVAGYLMDEVVPSAECLSLSLGKSDRIPESCRFLLHAYYLLESSSSNNFVSPAEWISFWSALSQSYTSALAAEGSRAGFLLAALVGLFLLMDSAVLRAFEYLNF